MSRNACLSATALRGWRSALRPELSTVGQESTNQGCFSFCNSSFVSSTSFRSALIRAVLEERKMCSILVFSLVCETFLPELLAMFFKLLKKL